ncbi:MAG TPA: signal peptidase I, partial [Elusimicrobiales bacterium]|nr:signal peptidase I [Elusimicrobiales bacterium]
MEEKLFWIGMLAGAYLFLTHRFDKKGRFGSEDFARAWHSLFVAMVSFSGVVLLMVSLDNRKGEVAAGLLFSRTQLLYGIMAAFAGGIWSYFKPRSVPRNEKAGKKNAGKAASEAPGPMAEDMEWSETIFSAVVLASVVMYLFVQAFKIPSGSMRNTFLEGDHLFVNKFIYGFRIPYTQKKVLSFGKIDRGDIVVFQFPSSDPAEEQCGGRQYGKDFIKRVIGLPGETVEIRNGAVYVNGEKLAPEPYTQYLDPARYPRPSAGRVPPADYQSLWENRALSRMVSELVRDNFGPVTVPQGSYLVMG